MKLFRFSVLFLLFSFPFGFASAASADCDSDGDIRYICGPVSPEDLLSVPDTPWVVVSSMEEEGNLSVAHSENYNTSVVFPSAAAEIEHDFETYADCPTPPGSLFRPHGVSLNSVTALPEGGFAATNFNIAAGNLWECQAARCLALTA